ncbi:MAG TPA: NAD-dependent epimerase/dehydratase family protein [Polyangiaceae bacterium]|nr:NAD-dependent epimerase/dehydratase family protein [Polyangiaceae bacterium]
MKVLVTGSNGFLGSALVRRLLAHGFDEPRCLLRAGSDRRRLDAIERDHPEQSIEVTIGSLSSVAACEKILDGVDLVFHVAAALGGSPADMFLGSVVTSKNLIEALPERVKVVLVSSFGVYGVAGIPRGATVDESTPLEPHPERRDVYSHTKLRQERLFTEHAERSGMALTVLRPGVIYGPGGGVMSGRVGLQLPGVFLYLGGDNPLPLSYVDNCAEALVVAAKSERSWGEVYNVHDDDLLTAREYLARYQREVKQLRSVPVPYPLLMLGSYLVERYHEYSRGQLPAIFTPYKTRAMWKPQRFSNAKLHGLGWSPIVSTEEGLARTFAWAREHA